MAVKDPLANPASRNRVVSNFCGIRKRCTIMMMAPTANKLIPLRPLIATCFNCARSVHEFQGKTPAIRFTPHSTKEAKATQAATKKLDSLRWLAKPKNPITKIVEVITRIIGLENEISQVTQTTVILKTVIDNPVSCRGLASGPIAPFQIVCPIHEPTKATMAKAGAIETHVGGLCSARMTNNAEPARNAKNEMPENISSRKIARRRQCFRYHCCLKASIDPAINDRIKGTISPSLTSVDSSIPSARFINRVPAALPRMLNISGH